MAAGGGEATERSLRAWSGSSQRDPRTFGKLGESSGALGLADAIDSVLVSWVTTVLMVM